MSTPDDSSAFTQVWKRDGPRVAAYVRRHVAAADVQDVVAETFLQAWRRWDAVRQPPIAWLVGAARKVIGNHRRAAGRRWLCTSAWSSSTRRPAPLTTRGCSRRSGGRPGGAGPAPDQQREALLLVAWDGLSPDDAATVLGVRSGTLRVRLHRARGALDPSSTPPRTPLPRH